MPGAGEAGLPPPGEEAVGFAGGSSLRGADGPAACRALEGGKRAARKTRVDEMAENKSVVVRGTSGEGFVSK